MSQIDLHNFITSFGAGILYVYGQRNRIRSALFCMGIHYVNGALVMDGKIDKENPEALIYEPVGNARRLVGVEYIVDAATWLAANNNVPPSLDGQDFQFVGAPNRFNLDPFFELHVWAGATIRRVHL